MAISPEIEQRMGLGPEEGQDFKLIVAVSSKGPANLALGADTARHTIMRQQHVAAEAIVSTEFAGRDEHGDPVFLVTWKLARP